MTTDVYLHGAMQAYLDTLNTSAPDGYSFDVTYGRKYTKVVMTARGGQRSVHSFVDAQGKVYKAAGWARPAEHVRFDLSTPEGLRLLLECAGTPQSYAGGYLYIR